MSKPKSDHYRFRAAEAEFTAKSKKCGSTGRSDARWNGFLDKIDRWQERASHRLSCYLTS